MPKRQLQTRNLTDSIYIVGEGITEQFYFTHLRQIMGYRCTIRPRFFGNTSIKEIQKKVEELQSNRVYVICVFDADVSVRDDAENKRLAAFIKKHKDKKNVLICSSLPSIEYWFLLHFENNHSYFRDSKSAEDALRKHLTSYKKSTEYLEREKWVQELCADNRISFATANAKVCDKETHSYTNVYRAIEILEDKNSKKV